MPLTITVVTPPTAEPITLDQAKEHCRIDGTEQDNTIRSYIAAARGYVETFTRRTLMPQTLRLKLDYFPGACWLDSRHGGWPFGYQGYQNTIYRYTESVHPDRPIILPRPPLVSVTSIIYTDTNGDSQTMSANDYRVDADSEPGRITPAYGTYWPVARAETNSVAITYDAGYASADVIPPGNKQAMLLLIGHWFENREGVIAGSLSKELEKTVDALLWQQRIEVYPQ